MKEFAEQMLQDIMEGVRRYGEMVYIRSAKYVLFMLFLIEKKASSYLLKWARYATEHFSKDFCIVYYVLRT